MAASLRPLRLCRASSTTALIAKCPLAYVPSQQPNTTSQHLHPRQPQRRSYAVTKRAPLSKNSRTWGTISIDGVTSHDFSRSDMVGRGDYFHHTPEQYFDCLQKFASAASGSDQRWVYRLNERERPTVQLIHETACMLRQMPWLPLAPLWSLALWAGASELGHLPSTLSLRQYLVYAGALAETPLFKPIDARFRSQVVAGKDPNVLALEGQILALKGKPNAAIRVLSRALELGNGDFAWRGRCEAFLGESYVKIGEAAVGCEHLRAAVSHGVLEAEETLAEATEDAGEASRHLYRAACLKPELFGRLAQLEMTKAKDLSNSQERKTAHTLAKEWSRLADTAAPY